MNDNRKMTFSDLSRRKSELKLEIVKKETEVRIGFESFVASLDPVKMLDRLWANVSGRLDPVARVATVFFSIFSGGRKRRRNSSR